MTVCGEKPIMGVHHQDYIKSSSEAQGLKDPSIQQVSHGPLATVWEHFPLFLRFGFQDVR